MDGNFQISTSAHPILVKMAPHVVILLEVINVIVKQDILGPTVKQVTVTNNIFGEAELIKPWIKKKGNITVITAKELS